MIHRAGGTLRLSGNRTTRDVFLSHRSTDKEFVRRLAADIESITWQGRLLRTWLDEAEIRPGQSTTGMINQGLEQSRFVAFIMTPAYFESESGWTDAEWHAALYMDPDNRRARLLPLLATDCPYIPPLMNHLTRIDMRGRDYHRGLERLLIILREEPLPRPTTFRGQLVRFDGRIDRTTLLAERSAPDADPDLVEEDLSCNLLPIESLPANIYSGIISSKYRKPRWDGGAAVLPSKPDVLNLVHRLQADDGKVIYSPAFRLVEDRVISFHKLDLPDCPLHSLVDEVQLFETRRFISDNENRNIVTSLTAMGLERKLYSRGLELDRSKRGTPRAYFPAKSDTERKFRWRPFKKDSIRCVAKPYRQNNRVAFWLHQAAYIKPVFLASKFYLQITPTWLLTEDGRKVKGGPEVGRIVIRWTGPERNTNILYHVRFWTAVLQGRSDLLEVGLGDQTMKVSRYPASIHLYYGIKDDQKRLLHELDYEANLIAAEEQEVDIEEASQDDELEQVSSEELQNKQDTE